MIENWLIISESRHRELRHEAHKDHLAREALAHKPGVHPRRSPLLVLLISLVKN